MADTDSRALARRMLGSRADADDWLERAATWLEQTLRSAREQHPGVRLTDEAFVDHLARHLPQDGDLEELLSTLRGDDLFLACACGHGDTRAIEQLTTKCRPIFASVLAQPSASGVDGEDLQQVLLERLTVGVGDGPPKILDYSGRGKLTTWIKVSATRLRIDSERRKSDKHDSIDGSSLERIEKAVSADMELSFLKQRYRAVFKEVFQQVLRELSSEQRNLLRLSVVEGLSATQIARSHGVDRATAKRWLVKVRAALLDGTEKGLAARLGVEEQEVRSVLRMVRTGLEVSMQRVLEEE